MNNHLTKILVLIGAIGRQIKSWFLELSIYQKIAAILGPIAIVVLALNILPSKKSEIEAETAPKLVEVRTVSELSSNSAPLSLVGQITSVNEATIRAESSGEVKVYKKLGDYVSAGQVIGEFENKSERAGVLQAEGAYESAKAARDIAVINTGSTNQNINDIKTNTINTLNSAYSTVDDIIRTKTDVAFSDPRTDQPVFKVLMPDAMLQSKIEGERKDIETMLIQRAKKNSTLTQDSDLLGEAQKMQTELQLVKSYLDDLGNAYAKSLQDQNFTQAALEGQKANVGIARTTISGTISSLSQAKIALQNGLTQLEVAGRTTGDKNPNTASVDAQVKSALGAYNAALARLENTIIRSPISGTINSLSIKTGDFVNQTSQVAVVSNNGALEIVAYVSSDDSPRVSVGQNVRINMNTKGVVTRVAKAIDPVTKKIEIRIGILDKTELINGQSVRLEVVDSTTTVNPVSGIIKIPLSAVKITPRGSYVFSLTSSSTLVSVPITMGTLYGDQVQIAEGLTGDMQIVKDARGLKEGEVVTQK